MTILPASRRPNRATIYKDPNYEDTLLLLHMDGSNGGATFYDSSRNNLSIATTGNIQTSSTQSKFGGTSAYFDGNGDRLTVESSNLFNFSGAGNTYTFEMWLYPTAFPPSGNWCRVLMFGGNASSSSFVALQFTSNGVPNATIPNGAAGITSSIPLVLNTWQHYAVMLNGSNSAMFLNGNQVASGTLPQPTSLANSAVIGYDSAATVSFNYAGYIDELRVMRGVTYSSNFTLPQSPYVDTSYATMPLQEDEFANNVSLLLSMNGGNGSLIFEDSSRNNLPVVANGNAQISTAQSKFGGASGLFDGNGDYLLATSNALSFGTGDFTVEGWMYVVDGTSYRAIASFIAGSDNNALYVLNQTLTWYDGGGRAVSGTFSLNAWHHFAVSRSSGVLRLFLNGVKSTTDYVASSNITSGSVRIGTKGAANGEWFNGYIDDLRITKGVARYTANFTPPATPFPELQHAPEPVVYDPFLDNVSLLLRMKGSNGSTTFRDSSRNNLTVTPNGNAQISTVQSKFGGSSGYFDGNGDFLTAPDLSIWDLPADFTIEVWVSALATGYSGIISFRNSVSTLDPVLYLWNTGVVVWYYNGSPRITGTTNLVNGGFYHVAVCRASGVSKLFINGVQEGSSYTNSASYTAEGLWVGSVPAASQHFNGYLDDLRITKGIARYTSNFNPDTDSFIDMSKSVYLDPYTQAGIAPSWRRSTVNYDSEFSKVSLLLHMRGKSGSSTFVDSSLNNYGVSAFGNAQHSTASSKFGLSSGFFDGTGDYLSFSNEALRFGTGDFTIEFWVNCLSNVGTTPANQYPYLMGSSIWNANGGFYITVDGPNTGWGGLGVISFNSSTGSNGPSLTSTSVMRNNKWKHFAVSRSGNTFRLFVDGTLEASSSSSTANYTGNGAALGTAVLNSGSPDTLGQDRFYMNELRITKGAGRYTSDFATPIAPFPDF